MPVLSTQLALVGEGILSTTLGMASHPRRQVHFQPLSASMDLYQDLSLSYTLLQTRIHGKSKWSRCAFSTIAVAYCLRVHCQRRS